jgi:alpha-tubulin suppressor-like RCC1 family protein
MADSQIYSTARLRTCLLVLSLATTLLITACGGGGGDAPSPAPEGGSPPTTTPVTTPTTPVTTPTTPVTTPTTPVTTPTTPVTTPTTPVTTPTMPVTTPTTPVTTPTTPVTTPTTPVTTPTTPPVTPTSGVKAEIEASKSTGFAYKLDAGSSATLQGRTIDSYLWNFGDGTSEISTIPVTHHLYRTGNYSVTVVITDSAGATATTAIGVTATAAPAPKLFSGYDQNFTLGANGAYKVWGSAAFGNATGIGSFVFATPTTATLLGNSSVTFVAVGALNGGSNCALGVDGSVVCSGRNNVGQLGDITLAANVSPSNIYPVAGLSTGVQEIATSENYSCARTATDVKCWGSILSKNSYDTRVNPVAISGWGADIVSLSVGHAHVCAISSTGVASCFGPNNVGQLGNGQISAPNTPVTTVPVIVTGLSARPVQLLANRSFGNGATCALNALGQVECWGANTYNIFGRTDTVVRSPSPTAMNSAPEKFTQLAVGEDHLCGLGVSGKVYCWGYNNQKQVSLSVASITAPVTQVNGLTDVVQLSAGQGHSCALQSDNQIYCWGKNFNGTIGNGAVSEAPQGVTRVVGSPF